MLMTVNAENFEEVVLNSAEPVLVDFFATWCGPCSALAPVVEELSNENPDKKICKIDIDGSIKIARKFKVMSIPTLIVFKDGKEVKRNVGPASKEEMLEMLK